MPSFGFEIHVSVLLGCVCLAAIYLMAVGPARRRFGWSDTGASPWRMAAYLGGVGIIFFSLNGPLHTLSDEYLFTAHMVQHMLLMLIMPPLLILGIPPWLISKALERPAVLKTSRVLTHPGVSTRRFKVTRIAILNCNRFKNDSSVSRFSGGTSVAGECSSRGRSSVMTEVRSTSGASDFPSLR